MPKHGIDLVCIRRTHMSVLGTRTGFASNVMKQISEPKNVLLASFDLTSQCTIPNRRRSTKIVAQKNRGASLLVKPAFHGACFGAVSAPILSARVPLRASAALKKNASTMNIAHVSMGADCRAD